MSTTFSNQRPLANLRIFIKNVMQDLTFKDTVKDLLIQFSVFSPSSIVGHPILSIQLPQMLIKELLKRALNSTQDLGS